MTVPRLLFLVSLLLFGVIGFAAFFKKKSGQDLSLSQIIRIEVEPDFVKAQEPSSSFESPKGASLKEISQNESTPFSFPDSKTDRIEEFFNKRDPKLPIVETVVYKSHVPWLKGRSAWIADYASHYKTSRHFIARSLNGKADYNKQDVSDGVRFNVLRNDIDFEFYLVADIKTCQMHFYYWDKASDERVFLKTYPIGIGRPDHSSPSGSLTPLGKYLLGDKIAVYRPKSQGLYQGKKIEMVKVFGTRWIPFSEEVQDCTAPAEGLGIHGLPLSPNEQGELVENTEALGQKESDGCLRLATKDIEELFSIIISRQTTIEIVSEFALAKPPGKESKLL